MLIYDMFFTQGPYSKECKIRKWHIPRTDIVLTVWMNWDADSLGLYGNLEYFLEDKYKRSNGYDGHDYFDSIGEGSMSDVLRYLEGTLKHYLPWYDRVRVMKWVRRNMKIIRQY